MNAGGAGAPPPVAPLITDINDDVNEITYYLLKTRHTLIGTSTRGHRVYTDGQKRIRLRLEAVTVVESSLS